jgi:hypothetical protein
MFIKSELEMVSFARSSVATLVVGTALALSPISARASVVYGYTGNDYSLVSSPFTTSEKVTGSVTFSSALGNSVPFGSATPIAFSFSDGAGDTISNLNDTSFAFFFGTNPSGGISSWEVEVTSASASISSFTGEDEVTGTSGSQFGLSFVGGQWGPAISATPLPAALPLFAGGLGAMGLLGWRKKRKTAAIAA